jgi:hypothetical protein
MKSIMEGIRVALREAQRPPAILLIDADSTGDRIRTFHWGQSYVEALMEGDLAPILIDWKRVQEQTIQKVFAPEMMARAFLACVSPDQPPHPDA